MLRCPSCKAVHPNNTLFCDQCGTQLPGPGAPDGTTEIHVSGPLPQTPIPDSERPAVAQELVLLIAGRELLIPIPIEKRITLGRADPTRDHEPDLDLSPHRAYDQGVSRQHAALYQVRDQFYVEDLSSRNGTFVNGRKVWPFQPEPVDHNSEIRLGTLTMHLLLR